MAASKPARARRPLRTQVLDALPTAVAVLWIAGVTQFRGLPMTGLDYAVLAAFAFALHALLRRMRPGRRAIVLPPTANVGTVALLAATITGVMALLVGAVLEAMVPPQEQGNTPYWLRTVWHAACAFGASYCRFLARVVQGDARPPDQGSGDAR